MRYIDNTPFFAVTGDPFKVSEKDDKSDEHEATYPEVVRLTLRVHQPRPGKMLDLAEIRNFNRVLETLEGKPEEGGYYVVDDADWQVVKKVLEWTAPSLSYWRNAPAIIELWEKAPTQKPRAEVKPSPDGNKARSKVKVKG